MRTWSKVIFITAILGLLGCGVALVMLANRARTKSNNVNLLDSPRHPVTDPMWKRAHAIEGKPAPNFTLQSNESKLITLSQVCQKGPVVLVFTKDGCPCSIEAQPFFNELAKGYMGKASFLGIIDANKSVATQYQIDFKVPYTMLLGQEPDIFKAYDSLQSVYTTLVDSKGKVVKQWPGYCKAMLIDLNERLATLTQTQPTKIELGMAPEKMNSGCAFEIGAIVR